MNDGKLGNIARKHAVEEEKSIFDTKQIKGFYKHKQKYLLTYILQRIFMNFGENRLYEYCVT